MRGRALQSAAAVWTKLMLTVLVVVVADDASTTTFSLEDVTGRPAERLQRMLVWARANPGGRGLAPLPPSSSSSVQLVGVDVRRIQRGTTSETIIDEHDDVSNSTTNQHLSLTDQLHRNRIRSYILVFVGGLLMIAILVRFLDLWPY